MYSYSLSWFSLSPQVIEVFQPLTPCMRSIQGAILVAMRSCVNELKKACSALDTTDMTLEQVRA